MTKYIDRYYLNGEVYGIKFGGGGWQPGANTLCYCPLEQDGADATGNYTFTTNNNGTSYVDNGEGQYVLQKASTSDYQCCSCNDRAKTIGIRAKLDSMPVTDNNGTIISQGQDFAIIYDNGWGPGTGVAIRVGDGNSQERWSQHYQTDLTDWHLYMFTYDDVSGDLNFYVDGQLFDTINATPVAVTELNLLGISGYWSRGVVGQFSKALRETTTWTAQEVQSYYDQFNSLYGIS